MLWFTKDKRSRMTRRYKERLKLTGLLGRDVHLYQDLRSLITLTEDGFSRAQEDEQEFQQLFGEPMPEHLNIAVHLETDLWVAIRTTLEAAQHAAITPAEYDRLIPQLRHRLGLLEQVLNLEAEIMFSPLSKHFREQLQFLREMRS